MGRAIALLVGVLWGVGLLLAIAAACTLLACGGPDIPPTPPTRVEVVRRACLAEPPPTHESIAADGKKEGCPERWATCLTAEATVELGLYLSSLQRWARDAWAACGPEPAKEE